MVCVELRHWQKYWAKQRSPHWRLWDWVNLYRLRNLNVIELFNYQKGQYNLGFISSSLVILRLKYLNGYRVKVQPDLLIEHRSLVQCNFVAVVSVDLSSFLVERKNALCPTIIERMGGMKKLVVDFNVAFCCFGWKKWGFITRCFGDTHASFYFWHPMLKDIELPRLLHLSAYIGKCYNQFYLFPQPYLSIQLRWDTRKKWVKWLIR